MPLHVIKRIALLLLFSSALGGILYIFMETNPIQVGPFGVLLVFGLLYVAMVCIMYLLLKSTAVVFAYFKISFIRARNLYLLASIFAIGPVFLLALYSIGQLDIKDVLLILAFIGLASFYVVRRQSIESQ